MIGSVLFVATDNTENTEDTETNVRNFPFLFSSEPSVVNLVVGTVDTCPVPQRFHLPLKRLQPPPLTLASSAPWQVVLQLVLFVGPLGAGPGLPACQGVCADLVGDPQIAGILRGGLQHQVKFH